MTGLLVLGLMWGIVFANTNAKEIRYPFENINDVCVVDGEVQVAHSPEGYSEPGCLTIGPIKTETARVTIGEKFAVNEGSAYLISLWAKPVNLLRCHGFLAVDWYDSTGSVISSDISRPIYTASRRPHIWDEMMEPVWMNFEIAKKTPERAAMGQVFINLVNNPGRATAGRNAQSSGPILIDDVLVTRTPYLEITTNEPGNLFIEGEPVDIRLIIKDIPQEISALTISDGVYDVWGNEMLYKSDVIGREGYDDIVNLGDLKRGYYEIRWRLSAGGRMIRSGKFSVGVVPDPTKRSAGEHDPFALDAVLSVYSLRGDDVLKEAARVAQRGGLRSLRDRMPFDKVNPRPEEFKWGQYLRSTKVQHDAGIDVLQIIHDLPGWLSSAPDGNRQSPPKNLTGIYNFFKNAARDMGSFVPFWESWNEADMNFFCGRPEEFAGIQKTAYLGARAGNPDATVTSNSFCQPFGWWAEMEFRNGIKDYFDVLNLHFYGLGEEDYVFERLMDFKSNTARFGVNQPWWMTEMGTTCFYDSTGSFTKSELQQAKKLVKAFVYNISEGCSKYFYFVMPDYFERSHDLWGIVHDDLTPKPAFIALANLTNILDKAEYRGKYNLGLPWGTAYVFNNGREDVLVAWSERETAIQLSGRSPHLSPTDWAFSGEGLAIQLSGNNVQARDMMGTPVPPDKISPYPVFFTGVELEESRIIEKPAAKKQYIRPDVKPLSLVQMIRGIPKDDYPAGAFKRKMAVEIENNIPLTVELVLCNFSDEAVTVSSTWKYPEVWSFQSEEMARTDMQPWEERVVTVTVIPQNVEKDKQYEISVLSTAPGRKIAPVVMGMVAKSGRR